MSRQKPIIVVAGLGEDQRPHAARFSQADETLATKAAALMGFNIGMAETAKAMSLARSLTKGRVFATGRALIPYVKQQLYDEMQTAIAFEIPVPIEDGASVRGGNDPLSVGSVVLVLESKELGWWEAVVLDVTNDNVTLKWRDWPKLKRFIRSRAELGIIGAAQLPELTP
jgi:hypothetical protein